MRKAAIEILEDEMSEYTLEHIKEIDYLEEWIVDAMIKFHESEVKKLNKLDVNRRSEQLICPECENQYPHSHTDGSYSCEDCGHKWAN